MVYLDGYGSIPRDTIYRDEHPFASYFGVHHGYRVLTHIHFSGLFHALGEMQHAHKNPSLWKDTPGGMAMPGYGQSVFSASLMQMGGARVLLSYPKTYFQSHFQS